LGRRVRGDRQHERGRVGLRHVLHHRAARSAAAEGRRLPGVWPRRRRAGEVRTGDEPRHPDEQLRQADADERCPRGVARAALPADAMISATFQSLPGLSYIATYNATTAEVLPSLGRNLAGGTRTVAVPLLLPQALREKRRSQVDLRLTKYLTMGKRRVQANFD